LNRAENAQQKQLVNDLIIGATSNLSSLTPDQIDARVKAIDSQLGIQQAIFREQFDKLKLQTDETKKNTLALVAVENRLIAVEGALTNFAEKPLTIAIEDRDNVVADTNVAGRSVFGGGR
jgi:hypothetical protein